MIEMYILVWYTAYIMYIAASQLARNSRISISWNINL